MLITYKFSGNLFFMHCFPTALSLTDVRCFSGHQRAVLRPITLLVGENSTGKSTFLGCYTVLNRLFQFPTSRSMEPDFNLEPFLLGSFREIVNSFRYISGQIEEFSFNVEFQTDGQSKKTLEVCFRETGSSPSISSMRWTINEKFVECVRTDSNSTLLRTPHYTIEIGLPLTRLLVNAIHTGFPVNRNESLDNYTSKFIDKWNSDATDDQLPGRNLAIRSSDRMTVYSPLRARPQRTYDPVRETQAPEGEHVPMLLARLSRTTPQSEWDKVRNKLVAFGKKSGLFSNIRVKGSRRNMSDPFQLQLTMGGGSRVNIADAGYGVSQVLPILVDVVRSERQLFVLQHVDIHLHPKAQAELSTFFVDSARRDGNRFLIETHSDYIIDRVRINVRQGRLAAEDVSILYFEPCGSAVEIHNLGLDHMGNLLNAPNGYREFFLHETDRLLGFKD